MSADAFVGTSDEYRDVPLNYNVDKQLPRRTVYVGSNLDDFDNGVIKFSSEINKGDGEFWVIYAGTLGSSYDIRTLVKAAQIIYERGLSNVKFKILGDGPLRMQFEQTANEKKCCIDFLGYTDYSKMAAYLAKSDITVNSFVKSAPQSIVNKIGDYLAAGKPMINTCSSLEFRKKVENDGFGINVEAEDEKKLADAIYFIYSNGELAKQMGKAARKIAEEQFDRKNSYVVIVKLIDDILNKKR